MKKQLLLLSLLFSTLHLHPNTTQIDELLKLLQIVDEKITVNSERPTVPPLPVLSNTGSMLNLKITHDPVRLILTKKEKEAIINGSNFRINEGKIINLKTIKNKLSSRVFVYLESEPDGSLIIPARELTIIINFGANIILDGKKTEQKL